MIWTNHVREPSAPARNGSDKDGKQTRVGCNCCCGDLFCVLCRSSAVPRSFRVKPIWFFSTKKKRRKLASKGKVKCGRRAWPNGLASRVEHHLVKRKKG